MTVRNQGLKETWVVALKGKVLKIDRGPVAFEYMRLDKTPPQAKLSLFPIGQRAQLSADRIQAIQAELHERKTRDQRALRDPEKRELTAKILAENLEYLRKLVQQVGWLDAERFGRQSSAEAILLAKHGDDLSLLQAILPMVERDFKRAGDDAQMFTILYDGLQIDLGLKQRYGTQLWESPNGLAYVLPLEDPSKVDQFRSELGLTPLAEYLSEASKTLYGGKAIEILND